MPPGCRPVPSRPARIERDWRMNRPSPIHDKYRRTCTGGRYACTRIPSAVWQQRGGHATCARASHSTALTYPISIPRLRLIFSQSSKNEKERSSMREYENRALSRVKLGTSGFFGRSSVFSRLQVRVIVSGYFFFIILYFFIILFWLNLRKSCEDGGFS